MKLLLDAGDSWTSPSLSLAVARIYYSFGNYNESSNSVKAQWSDLCGRKAEFIPDSEQKTRPRKDRSGKVLMHFKLSWWEEGIRAAVKSGLKSTIASKRKRSPGRSDESKERNAATIFEWFGWGKLSSWEAKTISIPSARNAESLDRWSNQVQHTYFMFLLSLDSGKCLSPKSFRK